MLFCQQPIPYKRLVDEYTLICLIKLIKTQRNGNYQNGIVTIKEDFASVCEYGGAVKRILAASFTATAHAQVYGQLYHHIGQEDVTLHADVTLLYVMYYKTAAEVLVVQYVKRSSDDVV